MLFAADDYFARDAYAAARRHLMPCALLPLLPLPRRRYFYALALAI